MIKTPELAMPRTNKVTTVCNGKREVWTEYEEAKAYFLELMMSTDGEEHDRAECVYIQLMHRLDECSDEDCNVFNTECPATIFIGEHWIKCNSIVTNTSSHRSYFAQ